MGSFITSLVTAYFVEQKNYYPIFILAAAYVALMILNNLLFYRELPKPGKIKTLPDVFKGIVTVCSNWRFLLLLVIFSGFWGMYNRAQDSALWLLKQNYMDMTPVNDFVTSCIAFFGFDIQFNFNVAHVMTINAGVIILFQVPVSYIVEKFPPLPTMVTGVAMASMFPLLVALSSDPWIFVLGLVIFSIGEITAYPKLISYVGLIAPRDKVAIYMGFVFLPVFFAAIFFDYANGLVWEKLVVADGRITFYWYLVAGLGFLTMAGLFVYHVTVGRKLEISE